MGSAPPLRIIESSDAAVRLAAAREWLLARLPARALIVSASRGAADDLARAVAVACGGASGLHRFSFAQLAAHLAAPTLAARGIAPASRVAAEAVAARVAFLARSEGALEYFAPVAATPGFPRALARTLNELLLARVRPEQLAGLPLGGADLALLLERFEQQFAEASASDRARLFDAAAAHADGFAGAPLLLLDVPLESATEVAFAERLIEAAGQALATVPFGDLSTLARLAAFGPAEVIPPAGASDLTALRRHLFAGRELPARDPTGEVRLFSAPGEGRECVEIARRVLGEAQSGVPLDEIAVILRSPADYVGLLEDALDRAGIPAWFDRGHRRPHPAGRAFLALLTCAVERLSAVRFAEYLSLGQVPAASERARPRAPARPEDDESLGFGRFDDSPRPEEEDAAPDDSSPPAEDAPVVDGTLRAPHRWERLLVESAVIGGDAARWARRLDGLAAQYERQLREERLQDPDSPAVARLERQREHLGHLRAFALPLVERLAAWPAAAPWSEWLARFDALAPEVLRHPGRVQRALAELRPLGDIGPVSLAEARNVLADRLRTLDELPPASRYGRVFVSTPDGARGRSFRVAFVPALAERLFPQKPREDPMLLDTEMRHPLDAGLPTQDERARSERLLLRLAVGAATDRLWLSYPRLDVSGARPRVPSFYLLDVMRAVTGRIPNHEALQRASAAAGGARLDWPAPPLAAAAIDEVEHDLATLRELVDTPDAASVRGHAHYLLQLNDALRRSVTRRWAHATSRWRAQDGIVRPTDGTRPMLARQRLGARPYSVSALQKFTTCPYQFALSAIYRLEPSREPEPLQRLDPLTRGAIFHEVQAEFLRAMQRRGRLPLGPDDVKEAIAILEDVLRDVAARHEEELAPAIPRVWTDEVGSMARDLRMWVRKLPDFAEWTPDYFEYSFGLSDAGRDPRSVPEPVLVDGRFLLRGSVDVIETRRGSEELRITDHKTGRNRSTPRTVIGGGGTLQPVVYGLAVERILGRPVVSGRLFYCTAQGAFAEHAVPLSDANRRAALEALEIIDRSIELGFLPPAPAERACAWCDFRPVCGPHEAEHVRRKPPETLADLTMLRGKP